MAISFFLQRQHILEKGPIKIKTISRMAIISSVIQQSDIKQKPWSHIIPEAHEVLS